MSTLVQSFDKLLQLLLDVPDFLQLLGQHHSPPGQQLHLHLLVAAHFLQDLLDLLLEPPGFPVHNLLSQSICGDFQHLLNPPEENDVPAVEICLHTLPSDTDINTLNNTSPHLLIHPEPLPAVIALPQRQSEEILPEDWVPSLSHQLVVHLQTERGQVPPDGGDLLVGQVRAVLLVAGEDLLQLHPGHGPGLLVL